MNQNNVQLGCICGREFWTSRSANLIKCPACKLEWNGRFIRYVRVQVRIAHTDDYITWTVSKEFSAGSSILQLGSLQPTVLHTITGMRVEEITREEYHAYDSEQIANNCVKIMSRLQEVLQK